MMAKTYKISIPKFVDKQKKLDGKRQFIRLDTDIFFDSKIDALKPLDKLIYLFLLTRLDANGEVELTEKYIKKCVGLERRFDLEKSLNVLEIYKLCTYCVQAVYKSSTSCVQSDDKNGQEFDKVMTKNMDIYKDTHVELKKEIKENKKNNYVKSRFHDSVIPIFEFYKKVLKRDNTYLLSDFRKQKILARLKDPPIPGIDWATDRATQCQIAICEMSLSDFHQGANEQGKRYVDLVDHCFKSQEKIDKWILEAIELGNLEKIRKYLEGYVREGQKQEQVSEQVHVSA